LTCAVITATQAIILVVVWGSAFTLITIGIKYVSPAWLVAYRLLLGTVILVTYMFVRGGRFPALSDKRWLWYSVLGITGMSLPFFLVSTGQLVVPSGLSAILIGAMPIITIILAHFFTEERLTVRKLIGFLVGFMGIIVWRPFIFGRKRSNSARGRMVPSFCNGLHSRGWLYSLCNHTLSLCDRENGALSHCQSELLCSRRVCSPRGSIFGRTVQITNGHSIRKP